MIFNTVAGASGVGLNFKVVGGTTRPFSPSENTIWVKTSTEITGWMLSPTQPSGASGMIWIKTGTSGSIQFNALKKNGIWIYLIECYQYSGWSWTKVEFQVYQNGKWNDGVEPFKLIYNPSKYPVSSWYNNSSHFENASVSLEYKNNQAVIKYTGWDNTDALYTSIAVDVSKYTTMKIVGTCEVTDGETSTMYFKAGLANDNNFISGKYCDIGLKNGEKRTINNTFDISNVSGTTYFSFSFQVSSHSNYTANFTITSVEFS